MLLGYKWGLNGRSNKYKYKVIDLNCIINN